MESQALCAKCVHSFFERIATFADWVIVVSVLVDIIKNNENDSAIKDKIVKKVREFASAV